ncbi:MAG: hypothetical protein AAGH15_16765 [Myxococcota bacterium]
MTIRALVLAPDDPIAGWSVHPFQTFRLPLRLTHGVSLRCQTYKDIRAIPGHLESFAGDLTFLATPWQVPAEKTIALFRSLAERPRREPIVYLDTFDQSSSPFFGILPYVDLYLKKQLLRDLHRYDGTFAGGDVVADWIHRTYGLDLAGWHFGSAIPEGQHAKVELGWNLGTARHLQIGFLKSLAQRSTPWHRRSLDVHYRVGLGSLDPKDYYSVHREVYRDALQPLEGEVKMVRAAGEAARVPLDVFQAELGDTRIGVSPFGWGEVTDRDIDYVKRGTLLVKPDMSHLRTEPDIYRPWVTYVPTRWDGSDAPELCRHYLARPRAAKQIIAAARRAYAEWYLSGRFVGRIGEVLETLSIA